MALWSEDHCFYVHERARVKTEKMASVCLYALPTPERAPEAPCRVSPQVLRCWMLHEWRRLWRRVIPWRSRWCAGCSDGSDDTDLFKWQTGQQQYLIRSQSCATSRRKATAYRSSCIIEAALILGGAARSLCVHAHRHARWTEAETIRRGSRW